MITMLSLWFVDDSRDAVADDDDDATASIRQHPRRASYYRAGYKASSEELLRLPALVGWHPVQAPQVNSVGLP